MMNIQYYDKKFSTLTKNEIYIYESIFQTLPKGRFRYEEKLFMMNKDASKYLLLQPQKILLLPAHSFLAQ